MTTTVPSPVLTAQGFQTPEEADILAAVLSDINTAFGGGLNLGLTTPQGQLASTLAAIIADKNSTFLEMISQVDPATAQGRMQDAIGRIYFQTRLPATSTLVSCTCTGAEGTVIPIGAQISDAAGNVYACVSGGVIPVSGTIDLDFANENTGPLPCLAGAANSIYVAIPGWDTVLNAEDGALGRDVETPQQFEIRRQQSVALNARGSVPSIRAAVLASGSSLTPPQIPTDVYVTENFTSQDQVSGGLTILKNSIYVAVVGGSDESIATAILSKKDVGCNYSPTAIFTASASGAVLTVTAVSSGTIRVGQHVVGDDIPDGTTVSSLGTGTGGTGTYNLSVSVGTVTSETMQSAVAVIIPDTEYSIPYPTYRVLFTRPHATPINIAVTIAAISNPPSNAQALLTSGLGDAFTGEDGGEPLRIGGTVYSSRFYALIASLLPGAAIVNVLVGTSTPAATSQDLDIDQYPTLGTVTVALV